MMMMPMDLQLFLDLQYEAAVHLLVHNMQRCFQIISPFFCADEIYTIQRIPSRK